MSILVVGAIHHDVIVDAPAIPRLDETLPGTGVRYAFGGKGGNQAVASGRLGAERGMPVAMAACLGTDAPGDAALQILQNANVNTQAVQRVDAPTGMSVAISLPNGGYGAVTVSASNQHFEAKRLVMPTDISWLVLQNELPFAINLAAAQKARDAGAKVLLNAAPARAIAEVVDLRVDVLVVNRIEAADLIGVAEGDLKPEDAAQALHDKTGAQTVLTLGGEGLWIADKTGAEHITAHSVAVTSTHGAGDAFVGALGIQLSLGAPMRAAARYANAAAALHVSRPSEARAAVTDAAVRALIAQTSSL